MFLHCLGLNLQVSVANLARYRTSQKKSKKNMKKHFFDEKSVGKNLGEGELEEPAKITMAMPQFPATQTECR
jgi:hypothetical protein